MEENLNGTPIVHEYDEHGRRIGSSGSKTARQYQWAKHQLQQLSVGEHTPLQFAYHPSGHEQTRATEQGFSLQHQWSDTGLLLQQQLGRNSDSNVVSLDDARVKRQSRQYDKAGRVLDTGRFRYHYDMCGRVVEKTEYKDGFRPKTTRFVWNGDDRLTHIELPNGGRYRYRYDPLGRRVVKECLSTQRITEYLWDGANIVQHSQKTVDGSVIQEIEYLYEPESFRPLAQVTHKADQASQLHYIVTDHAGTPQELCSENGDVVWQGEQTLWGHYQQKNALPNHGFRENAHNDELYCDLRYQGQIEDRESGLYYNVNRYYDADSGQYLSPDPIGFAGGLRPQAYVFNPLEWVDPLGLLEEVVFPKELVIAETTIQMQGSRNQDFKVANGNVGLNGVRGKPTANAHKQIYGDVVWHHATYDPESNTAKMQLVSSELHNANKPHKGSVKAFEVATGTIYESSAAKDKAKELNKGCS
ncbi:TPA: RHS repeat-associated core domain-containing protein [Vibrio vulnificus]